MPTFLTIKEAMTETGKSRGAIRQHYRADLYSDVNAAELSVPDGKPAVSHYVLEILGTLRRPLNDDDKRRFDLVVDRVVEMKFRPNDSSTNGK
jgi:hypothetical protein